MYFCTVGIAVNVMQLDLCYVMAILFHCGKRHAVRPMLCDGHSVSLR